MAKYRATVRVGNVEAKNPGLARSTLEEQLQSSGLRGWRVISVEEEGRRRIPIPPPRKPVPAERPGLNPAAALLLTVGTIAALYFLSLVW